ncbi:MAG: tetratricopeptide repeat protein, partial [Kiritimatiellae bacterium]|nr:tetratricopeptide repeat protein [Kiritimatiellia bacterium]
LPPPGGRKDPKTVMGLANRLQKAESEASRLLASGRPAEALDLVVPLVAEYPDLPSSRKLVVEALEAVGKLAEAREHIEAYLAHDPTDRTMLGRLAKIELEKGSPHRAARILHAALALPPTVTEPIASNGISEVETALRLDLGLALIRMGKKNEAIPIFEQILVHNPNNFQAHNNLGAIYTEKGDFERGLAHLRKAVALVPDRPTQLENLATALMLAGKTNEAFTTAQSLLSRNPGNTTAHAVIEELSRKRK